MTGPGDEDKILNTANGNFMCGVVEGFYGRPWTTDQRRLLFKWLRKMGMNTYLYAPKLDCKHRSYWRDLYSVEEADNLTSLVEAAQVNSIQFIYALAPGLDMTFSSSKDIMYLKRKLEQVSTFGCTAFALLFDDIDTEMCEADKGIFQTFAAAQVSVTNEIYQHLRQPVFLFCPTEYCATRAVPSVQNSEYLLTLGSKLLPGIDILWTGPKVVSKKISIQSLEEVGKVFQRPPVIWDNIHANDYDPKRLFLGPYDGRSPEAIPYLRGVLTNPNCEFESNYIAIHTLAQWCKSNVDGVKKDILTGERMSPITSDIKLETESDFELDEDIPAKFDTRYQPKLALKAAIADWLDECTAKRLPPKIPDNVVLVPPNNSFPPNVNTCMTVTTPTVSITPTMGPPVQNMSEVNEINNILQAEKQSFIVNSLNTPPVLPTSEPVPCSSLDLEPMDCIPSPVSSSSDVAAAKASTDSLMQVDSASADPVSDDTCPLSCEDLSLLVDLFYLPHEHGSYAVELLQQLHWFKSNCTLVTDSRNLRSNKTQAQEWKKKYPDFYEKIERVDSLVNKLFHIANNSLFLELYPYLYDLSQTLLLCRTYVEWLGCTNEYKECFMSGELEPWIFRGGLQAEFQRMLPLENAPDLFQDKPPHPVCVRGKSFRIRSYKCSDESSVYDICRRTCDDGMDGTDVFPDMPDLIGDRLVGGLVTLSSEYCFVLEDQEGICGYALATLDARRFRQKCNHAWLPSMRKKYPKPTKDQQLPCEEVISSFHSSPPMIPDSLLSQCPSMIRMDVLASRITDPTMIKRLLACTMCALKTNGSIGIFCELQVGDKFMVDFYTRLGFAPLESSDTEAVYMGRILCAAPVKLYKC